MRGTNHPIRVGAILLSAIALAACQSGGATPSPTAQPPATQSPAAQTTVPSASGGGGGGQETITIGYTVSQTGSLNVESTRQQNGLELWVKDVNAAGGIKLSDGTTIMIQTKSYDDESSKDRVQELYTTLVNNDHADFLISPYSSGLADASAVIAEQYSKVMITTGAASDGTYKKGYTHVYQAYTPASHYLTGAADLLKSLDPNAKKIAIVN